MTNEQYEARKQALIAEIGRVFDGVERKDGVTIHETRVLDDCGSDEERAEARLLDTETRWQEVPDEDLRFYYDALIYFDPAGFRYYLPAYLVWYLRFMDCEDEEFWSNSFASVDFRLLARSDDTPSNWLLEKFSLFTTAQRKVVAEFLVFLRERAALLFADEHDVERYQHALDVYWQQFL